MDDAAVYAAALTAAAGFIGSWIGAQLALSNFKKQRAFDKQLDWYEKADERLQDLIEKIEIALTYQEEQGIPAANRTANWEDVQGAHLHIDRIASQAALFASPIATRLISTAAALVQTVADKTEAFDPPIIKDEKKKSEALKLIDTLPDKLRKTERQLIIEARRHLGFDAGGFLLDNLVVARKWPASVLQRLTSHRG
jgi:TPR repeat protein